MTNKNGSTPKKNPKTATNNQWTNTNLSDQADKRPRKDGPGGN